MSKVLALLGPKSRGEHAPEGGGESLETPRVIATLGVSYFSSGKKRNKFIRQPAQPPQALQTGRSRAQTLTGPGHPTALAVGDIRRPLAVIDTQRLRADEGLQGAFLTPRRKRPESKEWSTSTTTAQITATPPAQLIAEHVEREIE